MTHGRWRSLAAWVSGAAFAVSVAGPVQWDPCPMHGVHMQTEAAAGQMAADHQMHGAASHTHGGDKGTHPAGHQCTCPGGCAGSTPVGLSAPVVRAPIALHIHVPANVAQPSNAVELASSPQVALPFAHAPPAFRVTLQHAARVLT